jgi:hypothetical protein
LILEEEEKPNETTVKPKENTVKAKENRVEEKVVKNVKLDATIKNNILSKKQLKDN